MTIDPLMNEFLAMSQTRPPGSTEFSTWIDQQDFLAMLARNASDAELVLYASVLPGPYLHSMLVPLKSLHPVDLKDLLQWNDCGPYKSWGVSWSRPASGKTTRVRLSSPLEHSGSRTIDQGEQIVFARQFEGRQEDRSYIELAPTLTHPHDIHYVPEHHAYCRFDEDGNLESVVRIVSQPESEQGTEPRGRMVTIRRDLLDKHLFATDSALVRVFDSPRVDFKTFSSWGAYEPSAVSDGANEIYGRLGKNVSVGSFLRGVQIIRCSQSRRGMLRLITAGWRTKPERYAVFIALDFKNRRIHKCSCDPGKLANYFVTSPLTYETTPAFFKPDVLLKYKADPNKYRLSNRGIACRNAWHLQAYGLNDAGQVHAYLLDLSRIPFSEQLYWQSFNEPPKAELSEATYRRDFLGEFVADEDPLRRLKRSLKDLSAKAPSLWRCKDTNLFETVHLPVTTAEVEWSSEILELAKLMVEGFETGYLRRQAREAGISEVEKLGSMALIQAILAARGWEDDAIRSVVSPLKEVQMLRSKLRGHASGLGARSIVAEVMKKHGSDASHFRSIADESESAIRALIDCAARGLL